jgi:uncharacterized membrane protein
MYISKKCFFGHISNNETALSDAGKMMKLYWIKFTAKFENVVLDEFVIMPNHVHGIIQIVGAAFMTPNNVLQFETQGAINRAPTLEKLFALLRPPRVVSFICLV